MSRDKVRCNICEKEFRATPSHINLICKDCQNKDIEAFLEVLHILHRKIIDENLKRNMSGEDHTEYNDHFVIEIEKWKKRLKL